jgi:hypothetical protein
MKKVTRYEAKDGSEWKTAEEAGFRDGLVGLCDVALSELKPTPKDCNWEGYVQQDADALFRTREKLFVIANQDGVLKWWIDSQKSDHGKTDYQLTHETHPSWFGRMLDGEHGPLDRAYWRMCCIDGQGREWNQPYFAKNTPENAKCVA